LDHSKDLICIELTKEQWEEIYQWYLIVDSNFRIRDFEYEAATKIANTLKSMYGSFR